MLKIVIHKNECVYENEILNKKQNKKSSQITFIFLLFFTITIFIVTFFQLHTIWMYSNPFTFTAIQSIIVFVFQFIIFIACVNSHWEYSAVFLSSNVINRKSFSFLHCQKNVHKKFIIIFLLIVLSNKINKNQDKRCVRTIYCFNEVLNRL